MVIVDTSIWSEVLRRHTTTDAHHVTRLESLIDEERIVMIGPIRQELLSGIRERVQFLKLRRYLRSFADLPITSSEYELAATHYNQCRSRGIQGSHIDFLICAVSQRHKLPIYTSDKDFINYQKVLNIRLF